MRGAEDAYGQQLLRMTTSTVTDSCIAMFSVRRRVAFFASAALSLTCSVESYIPALACAHSALSVRRQESRRQSVPFSHHDAIRTASSRSCRGLACPNGIGLNAGPIRLLANLNKVNRDDHLLLDCSICDSECPGTLTPLTRYMSH